MPSQQHPSLGSGDHSNSSKGWRAVLFTFLFQVFVVRPLLWLSNVFVRYTTKNQMKRTEKRYLNVLASTEDHKTWMNTALSLDTLRGIKAWQQKLPENDYCNPAGFVYETEVANELARTGNIRAIGTFLRTMLHRRANGATSPLLFRYYTGTKAVVEEYNEAICRLLKVFSGTVDPASCCDGAAATKRNDGVEAETSQFVESIVQWGKQTVGTSEAEMTPEEKYSLLSDTIRSYGKSALMLSGGASLGMYHIGVIRALFEAQLLPQIMSGSSAGAIIAAVICTRTEDELHKMLINGGLTLKAIHLNAFEVHDNAEVSIGVKVDRLLSSGAFMDVETLKTCLQQNCGDSTFLESFKKTGRILNVSVANSRPGEHIEKHMLLNYVTSPNVLIWSAVAASCAMPGLFTAVQLVEKNEKGEIVPYQPGQLWFDGSVARDLPKEELSTMFNVNYFVVSQTNPHVIPFLRKPPSPLVHKKRTGVLKTIWFALCAEGRHWLLKLYRSGILPKTGGAEVPYLMATQSYDGDLTIFPIGSVWQAIPDFINLTSNPSEEHMEYVISNAQRRTWPHLNQIRCVTVVEKALQDELEALKPQCSPNEK